MIAGRLADARRLASQAQVMETTTMAFLTRAGLVAGAAALDTGCGDGQVTIAMARGRAPRGLVVGVDVDADALAIAQAAAARWRARG
jgi:tRNA A58 N-methylase Trm61